MILQKLYNKITLRQHYEDKYQAEFQRWAKDLMDATTYAYPPTIIKGYKTGRLKNINAKGPVILMGTINMQQLNITGTAKKRVKLPAHSKGANT